MKKNTILSAILLCGFSLSAQTPHYEIRGVYQRPVTEEILFKARTMSDILPAYPASWISSYTSTELSLSDHGKTSSAGGLNDTLSAAQCSLLKTAGLHSELKIRIRYTGNVFVTNEVEHNTLETAMTVIPETEASFPGGQQALMSYIKERSPFERTVADPKKPQQVVVRFTVNELGNTSGVKILRNSGSKATDRRFLELIRKMPAWKPAENKGMRVSQEFELSAGNGGGC